MCKFCSNENNRALMDTWMRQLYSEPAAYCPLCGAHMWIMDFVRQGLREAADEFVRQRRQQIPSAEETVEIDGEKLTLERIPSSPKKPTPKPMDMTFDLDKINIDREMALLRDTQIAQVLQTIDILHDENMNKKGEE